TGSNDQLQRSQDRERDLQNQVDALRRTNEELKQRNEAEIRDIEQKAQARLQGVINPLYAYYQQNAPAPDFPQAQYAVYAYFMGLSQIMLEAVADLARLMVNACNNSAWQYLKDNISEKDSRWLLAAYQECKADNFNQLRTILNNSGQNIEALKSNLERFIVDSLNGDQNNIDDIIPALFLDNELQSEHELNQQLREDQSAMEQMNYSFDPAIRPAETPQEQAYVNVLDEIRDSNIRGRIIDTIRKQTPLNLRQFFLR